MNSFESEEQKQDALLYGQPVWRVKLNLNEVSTPMDGKSWVDLKEPGLIASGSF